MDDEIDYQSHPVEGFGTRMLRKFGYVEGQGLGKCPKGETPVMFRATPRPERIGVGASDAPHSLKRDRLHVGCTVKIVQGKHAGLVGVVADILYKTVQVELEGNSTWVSAPLEFVEVFEGDQPEQREQQRARRKLKWVVPGLKVAVKNKRLRHLYGRKLVVHDVLDQYVFTVLADGKIEDSLTEKDIQTVVPAPNQFVRVLDEGVVAKVVSRDRHKHTVTVTKLDDHEVRVTSPNNVCEYVHIQ